MPEASSPAPHIDRSWRVIAVVGPTASGKTALAEEIAERLDGEIVSSDSMQIYRGMDIGTAKPAPDERRVPYHCLDLVDPGTPYSAALFQRTAREAIAQIVQAGRIPVIAGGTGMYVRAALDDWTFPTGDQSSPARIDLEALAERIGAHAMHQRLQEIDPAAASLIHPNNVRRTVRALEMATSGVSYAEQAEGFSRRATVYDTTFIGLHVERQVLYRRIDERVDTMISAGLLDEVRALLEEGFRKGLTATQAIGYKELVPVIEGDASLDDAVAAIKQASRRYAKRQSTWWRSDPRIQWIDVTTLSPSQAANDAYELLESAEHDRGHTTR